MGVTLDLRMIDHQHVVENGLLAVNDAVSRDDTACLAEYILSLPFERNSEVVALRQARYDKLRELNAPQIIIENEERILRLVTGESYSRDHLTKLTLDELRETLGTWRWAEYSFSVDKRWWELEWFLQPREGREAFPLYPIIPNIGDPAQTLLDQALHGSQLSPADITGTPIIKSCGSPEDGCFGYNPPDAVREIALALRIVNTDAWDKLVPQRIELHRRADEAFIKHAPEKIASQSRAHRPDKDSFNEVVDRELEFAREGFDVLLTAYNTALDRGFGIATEYCL